jgi:hypothetical protein
MDAAGAAACFHVAVLRIDRPGGFVVVVAFPLGQVFAIEQHRCIARRGGALAKRFAGSHDSWLWPGSVVDAPWRAGNLGRVFVAEPLLCGSMNQESCAYRQTKQRGASKVLSRGHVARVFQGLLE